MSALSFLISLDDKISPGAKSAAGSLAELDASLKKDQASLRTMEGALKRLESAGGGSEERINSLKAAIEGKKAAIGETTNSIADFRGETAGAGEASGMLGDKLAAMGGPAGIALAVFTALAAATVALGVALVSMALKSASAYRNQLLLNTAMAGSAVAGKAMTDATYRVARSTALGEEGVQKLASSLAKAGLTGSTYERSLKNLADVASVAGEEATGPIKEIIEKSQQLGHLKMEPDQLKGTGLQAGEVYKQLASDLGISVKDVEQRLKDGKITAEQGISALNKAMESKFGALAGKKLLDFDTQISKAKEGFAGMFRDVNLEPFLLGLRSVLGLLDESTASGRLIKTVLGGAVQGFFDAAAAAFPYVKEALIQIAIAGLRTYIAMKPAIAAIKSALSAGGDGSSIDAMETVGTVARVVGYVISSVLVVAMGSLAAIVGVVYGTFAGLSAIWSAAGSAASAVGGAISGAFTAAMSFIAGLDFVGVASNLIAGLVSGIQSGTGMVIAAISGLGSSAIGALKSTLGIASPSRVFAGLGGYTAEGFAGGVDKGAAMVSDSVNAMVAVPSISPTTAGAPTAGGAPAPGGGGVVLQAGAIVIQIDGAGKDAKQIADEVEDRMGLAFEKLAEMLGIPAQAAAA